MENFPSDAQMDQRSVKNHISVVRDVLLCLGEDTSREGLRDTPERVAKSWLELYAGYKMDPAKILSTTFKNEGRTQHDQMVVVRNIEFFSFCEHHMLPFYGHVSIGYLPKERVVGLSKLARLVVCFSKRLQIQERLTEEICAAIETNLDTVGVGVVVTAKHTCMVARGVAKQDAEMVTSALRGEIREKPEARAEFLSLIGGRNAV
jgi:GTP cyclohydrolase I